MTTRHVRRLRRTLLLVVAGLLLAVPGVAEAQGGPARGEMERQVRARFAALVVQQLGLSRAEGDRLGEILRDYQERREELRLEEIQLRRRLLAQGTLLPRNAPPLVSAEEAREILGQMEALREREDALEEEEQAALLEVLDPPQLVRFYALREALVQRIGRLREGGLPGRRGPPGGGGPPGPPSAFR